MSSHFYFTHRFFVLPILEIPFEPLSFYLHFMFDFLDIFHYRDLISLYVLHFVIILSLH